MPTSLAEQLQRLAVPQSSIYNEDRKKASLLFDPKEAATKDRDTFYEIGISGLKGLISLYEGFRFYEDTLFSLSSKEFERVVQSKEANESLNRTIEKFLRQLSPYFQLQSAHKALEWLVNRYHIHQYNQDAIMALILPYHETMIFVRFIQIMDIKSNSNRWNWLVPLRKPGIPLAKQVLYNHCASELSLLKFIAKTTWTYVKDFGERATKLNAVFAFFCSTAIGTIDASKHISESLINTLLSTIMKALMSPIDDFRSSAYIVIGYMSSKIQLKVSTLNEIISRIIISEYTLTYDMALLVNLMYTQTHVVKITENVLYDISLDRMQQLCFHLKKMIQQNINVMPFMLIFFSSVLRLVQVNMEEFKRLRKLPEIIISDVDFKSQSPKALIECVLRAFDPSSFQESNGYESDIEIIDDDNVVSNEMTDWYSGLLQSLEQKYPDAFDNVIKSEFNAKNEMTDKKHAQLTKILGFKPAVAHKFGDTYLFENVNHANPTMRIEAVRYLAQNFVSLKSDDAKFLKDSIIDRFNDDDADVVKTVLKIPIHYIEGILTPEELTGCFINIISKTGPNYKQWQEVVRETIDVFCSLDILNVNQEVILVLLPYLFPKDKKTSVIAMQIMNSAWGKKFALTKSAVKKIKAPKTHTDISEAVFTALNNIQWDKNWIHSISKVAKGNTLNVCLFLFMKSFTLVDASVEESAEFLNYIVQFVKTREIVGYCDDSPLSSQRMVECIQLCAEDKILFPMIQYLFVKVIQEFKVQEVSKPWCNICVTPESMLLKQIFEICVIGCGLPQYSTAYCSLLQQLLNKFCSNAQEKLEFIANFSCGHLLFAEKAEAIITPELQLRSLKLLKNCIDQSDMKNMPWIYESNITTALLFALNNPLSVIRQCAIDTIQNIVNKNSESDNCFHTLFQELISRKNELILDHEQIQQVLYLLLSQDKTVTSNLKKSTQAKMKLCLNQLVAMVTDNDTPAHISSELLALMANINSSDIFTKIAPAASRLHRVAESVRKNETFSLDVYESKLLRNIYSRINEKIIKSFEKEQVWEMILSGIKEYKDIVINEYQTLVSPCLLILKQIDGDSFKVLSENRGVDFISNICIASTFSNNPDIVSVAAKLVKKIDLNISHFKDILTSMLNVKDPATEKAKKRNSSTITMLSHRTAETDSWKLGVTILEYIQSKKKLTVDNTFMPLLFKLLEKCLEFEEQSYVEYTKQLILSSIWFYCQKFVNQDNSKQIKIVKASFDIELVVKCIRGTQNPQTHHHALMLLSHAAYILPEQVLNHTMAIFTFIGSSVLMHDDAYSFQIIIKIIETIIPILAKLDKNIEEYNEKELQQLQARVVPVLRIFADVVLDVPEHRRLLLYKKLIETLGPSQFLWIFLALLLETHLCHWNEKQDMQPNKKRSLAQQELPINRLDFGQSLLLEFPADIGLENCIHLIGYLKTLPLQKDEDMMDTGVNPGDIFSVSGHSAIQLRHYRYMTVTFMNTCLSSPYFIQHTRSVNDAQVMEKLYKTLTINILMFITSVSKVRDETGAKYWKVMLHYSYDLLDNVNNLLSAPMFVSVVRGLLAHNLQTVRRKAMELLNSKIQYNPEMFAECDKELLYSLIPALMEIVKTIDSQEENLPANVLQKVELNQQMALLSLKLMTRMLAVENPTPFKPILECVTEYTCKSNVSGNVMASIVLCLAELCSNLKAHAISSLPKFMPALINVLKSQRKVETPELIMLSTITALSKIVESLPLFLSPYLKKILYEYSILLAKWQKFDQECSKVSAVVTKLTNIKKKMASSIAPRVLIPVTSQCYQMHVNKGNLDSIGPVMSVLAESFTHITPADFTALQQDLTTFYLKALQLRSDASSSDASVVDSAEEEIVNALVCLVLKLSETSFRPFYFKLYDWAIRTNIDNEKDRTITFYRLSSAIADKLKGLFVLFAGHFIKNAAQLLDQCNKSKSEELYFDSEEKCATLIEYIIKTLHIVFLYDSQNFVNKDRFETLMQPIVDQLENTLGGISALNGRCKDVLIPCISQFAVAIADDSLWKPLNYQILLKTRHNDAEIRMLALDCLVSMASQLGSSWLPLLAESVPFLAELLEDGDARIENSTKEAVRKLEQILGEPLQKYF